MFYGSKKLIQLFLKPKNSNLSSKTQRRDHKIWAIWKPKMYTSQSVKKKGTELWGSVSIYRGQRTLKNRHERLGCKSKHILLRQNRKKLCLIITRRPLGQSPKYGNSALLECHSALQNCRIGLWTPNTLSCSGAIWTPLLGFFLPVLVPRRIFILCLWFFIFFFG